MSNEFRILGRRHGNEESIRFTYKGVDFDQDCFHVVAGLNAVDTREYVEQTFAALKGAGQVCARMGAYKPRTSPYSFQGYGKQCLPYVFELAGKYGIRVISMEVTRDEHLDEIRAALRETGDPTGVMLQIGTRNTQNFELLKTVGSQRDFPILLKRGFGITLHESLLAAEYVASAGNRDIVFCLRGMKTNFGDPHRNLVDFAPRAGREAPHAHAGVHRSVALGRHPRHRSRRAAGHLPRGRAGHRRGREPRAHRRAPRAAPRRWSTPRRRSRSRSCPTSSRTARSRARPTRNGGGCAERKAFGPQRR